MHPIIEHSYQSFLSELEDLLDSTGITPTCKTIQAEVNPQKNRSDTSDQIPPQLGRIIIYVEKHLTEQLSLEILAKETELSKYQLIREFRKEKGITPWKYVISRRIEKAKKLLENGKAPAQVAVETGFYDQPHFSRSFREETGQTPKKYQEENFQNRN